jgi:hypothetical protein
MKETKVINISKKVYNTIRSIVESSLKKDYHWNMPVCTPSGYIKFVKYKNTKTRQWEINVVTLTSPEGRKIGTAIRVFKGIKVIDFVIRELCFEGETSYTLTIYDSEVHKFDVDTFFDLEAIYINADVPFSYFICLADLAERLLFYLYLAERAKAQAQYLQREGE